MRCASVSIALQLFFDPIACSSTTQLKSIVKRTMREADKDKDEKISLAEFKAVRLSSLYLKEHEITCKLHKCGEQKSQELM